MFFFLEYFDLGLTWFTWTCESSCMSTRVVLGLQFGSAFWVSFFGFLGFSNQNKFIPPTPAHHSDVVLCDVWIILKCCMFVNQVHWSDTGDGARVHGQD